MKRFAPFLLLVVLLALGGAVIAPMFASGDRLKDEAVAALEEAIGRPVRVRGEASFSILPWPALQIDNVAVGGLASASVDVPSVRVVLDVLPMLTGAVRAARIDLHRPRIILSGAIADSLAPWFDLAAVLGRQAPRLHLTVSDGSVLLTRDGITAPLLHEVEGDIVLRGGRSLKLSGQAGWRGETLDYDGEVSDLAAISRGAAGYGKLSVSGSPLSLAYQGNVRLADGAMNTDGDLDIASPLLRDMLGWIGIDPPTEEGLGPFRLRGRAMVAGDSLALANARLDLDGNRADGGLSLRIDKGRPVIQGSFAAETVDLSPYGRLSMSDPEGRDWNRDPIDARRLHGFDLDLRVSAGQVIAGGTPFDRVAASAFLKGGRLSLAIGEAEGWKGDLRASANIAPTQQGGSEVRVELAGTDVDLAAALASLIRQQRLEGTGSFRMAVNGTGMSVADILANLSGTVSLDAANGAILGIDVGQVLNRLQRRPLSGGATLRGGTTEFDELHAAGTVRQGIVAVDTLTAASNTVKIDMTGDVSLAERTLDLRGTAGLVSAARGDDGPFELPFVVEGGWDSPYLLPDAQAMIRRSGAARPLLPPSTVGAVTPEP
ncbi:AsmA family protein [Ancylobacter sp. 6x-1]|uniref:AsmA family protein n=1 Tax=Ancylobacter crimeensis TaxID=2579147 RepID=A0ABT0D903_9HYPH|nr:AsmA family protein [Ancylobacter crimeensis]MCK0196431.1 AsmA family protein [Ancylobacter crimeensis]